MERWILIVLMLVLQTPEHQQLVLGQVQPSSRLQAPSCPWEWDEGAGLPSNSQQTIKMELKQLSSV